MPSRQKRQCPQVKPSQGMPTRSPGACVVTFGPHEIDPTDDLMAGHDRIANIG